ncbi:Jag N-terminal domain-containing protein [uncultured Campylobacter sp.]|uniref:Jag N-terminal domain-containing protein n=1 Tax=uncultured Campylobacter sp. TaxID=218934 RepID=UPI0026252EDA|nr:Jag N-terminal domain-containing protein [uncultured Campylobacter sp.]
MKIEAKTLQEAFSKAAHELECSVTELEYEVIQFPSSGFLGFFQKNAIIEIKNGGKKGALTKSFEKPKEPKPKKIKRTKAPKMEINEKIIDEIYTSLKRLLEASCFKIELIDIFKSDENELTIKLDGEDAALVIGKDGRRYKALLYMLQNWLNLKYGLNLRLELSKFLQTQEEMIAKYLEGIIERINTSGKAATKPLDGILVDIALKQLREKFPDKYVAVRNGKDGKFIIVNDFRK